MDIQWREIPGFDDRYLISSDGAVVRKAEILAVNTRRAKSGVEYRNIKQRVIIPERTSKGLRIVLRNDGSKTHCYLDYLVLLTFAGPNLGCIPHHKNGDILDNRIDNLEWIKAQHLIPLKVQKLLEPQVCKYKKTLTQEEVEKAFTDMRDNKTVGDEIGISALTVELIKQRVIWTKYTNGLTRNKRNNVTPVAYYRYPYLVESS